MFESLVISQIKIFFIYYSILWIYTFVVNEVKKGKKTFQTLKDRMGVPKTANPTEPNYK